MINRLVILFLLLVGVSCAQKPKQEITTGSNGEASGNSNLEQVNFQMKEFQETVLSNGLRLILVPDQALPRVSIGVIVKTGSADDPVNKLGLASFASTMLENGTKNRSATKLADDFGQIASELGSIAGSDYTYVSSSSISTEKERLLELFADSLLNPAFEQKEINREKAQVLSGIEKRQDNPSHYADLLITKENFGTHPYGHSGSGELATVKSINRKDIQDFYAKYYSPQKSILYLTGAFDNAFVEKVKKTFSVWKGNSVATWASIPFKPTVSEGVKLFTKPELKQAQIRFAERGVKRTDPDYLALKLGNLILGGDFVSRLNLRVRDELGLTYSIHSDLDARMDFGSFDISTFSRNEKVGETIAETKKVLQQFTEKGVLPSELEAAKALLAGQFPAAIETTDKMVHNLLLLRIYGVSDDYLKKFISNLNAVTLEQVNKAIKDHIHPENFKIIVYADEAKVLEQLKTLGKVDVVRVSRKK